MTHGHGRERECRRANTNPSFGSLRSAGCADVTFGRKLAHRFAEVFVLVCGAVSCSVPSSMPERPRVVRIQARKFAFSPSSIHLRKGIPVTLELESLDRVHGFAISDLDTRANIVPGRLTHIEVLPKKTGSFVFRCDVFCGDGHEDMVGTFVVDP